MSYHRDGAIIRSEEGWTIQTLGRTQIKYLEHGRAALISCEFPFSSEYGIALYPEQIRDWEIPSGRPITPDERSLLIARVTDALKWTGLKVHIRENGITLVVIKGKPDI